MSVRSKRSAPCCHPGVDPHEGTILLVESDSSIGRELVEQLRTDGYYTALASTTEHARSLARTRPIRAILLGVLDAPRDALNLLREVRSSVESIWGEGVPVIVLGPGSAQLDVLRALEMGADDFIAQPICYLELRARLRAVLRRAETQFVPRLLRIGSLEIDICAHLVSIDGASVGLSRLEYQLLVHLARNPNSVCSKQELLRAIWNQPAGTGARTVDSHASRLRRKLDRAGAGGLVVNVWGLGYRLV
jgi:DNA-binding response OmpR family regulator